MDECLRKELESVYVKYLARPDRCKVGRRMLLIEMCVLVLATSYFVQWALLDGGQHL